VSRLVPHLVTLCREVFRSLNSRIANVESRIATAAIELGNAKYPTRNEGYMRSRDTNGEIRSVTGDVFLYDAAQHAACSNPTRFNATDAVHIVLLSGLVMLLSDPAR
jgi:hypothetical protein